ncbi:hypothetical protein K492DRAFT_236856 [Lichtheimia hyalospora FSU 10163]|nr:hypothetical protein K492DRAFT_236856 [Lichtheimia hyalospora FSU 10163]
MVGRRRKQKRSSPFIHHVLLPGLRSTILVLGVLAIAFGSWLETTPSIDDCTFKRQMSMRQVSLYRNLTDNDNLPDTVSFGLWRHCFIYALNCTCTTPNLSYGLDATTILQGAFSNTTMLPNTHTTSYWNSVPLIMATALSAIAFIFGVAINIIRHQRLQFVNAGIVLASLILTVIAFAHTYTQYNHDIQQACEQYGQRCVKMDHGAEFIALVLGIALLGVACLTWAYAPKKDNDVDTTTASVAMDTKRASMQHGFATTTTPTSTPMTPSDVLEPWREAAMLDDEHHRWTRHTSYQPIHDNEAAFTTEPLPPPPPGRRRTSRTDYYDLVPPSRPFAHNNSPRRSSHGSGNTFGADNMMNRGSRTSSTMLDIPVGGGGTEDMYYHYYTSSSSDSHSPTRSHRRQSSGALTSSFGQQRRRSQSPFRSGHSSHNNNNNNRAITDQRISAYLQRQDQAHLP